jgi:hypothetical protein
MEAPSAEGTRFTESHVEIHSCLSVLFLSRLNFLTWTCIWTLPAPVHGAYNSKWTLAPVGWTICFMHQGMASCMQYSARFETVWWRGGDVPVLARELLYIIPVRRSLLGQESISNFDAALPMQHQGFETVWWRGGDVPVLASELLYIIPVRRGLLGQESISNFDAALAK